MRLRFTTFTLALAAPLTNAFFQASVPTANLPRPSKLSLSATLSKQFLASDMGIELFNNEDAVRDAYDEWRAGFGKGSFDADRYENFKSNFKTLTVANLEARDNALQQGSNPPEWMVLNEFGDFTEAEYRDYVTPINVDVYKIYEDWCKKYDVSADPYRYGIFSSNYKAMIAYERETGAKLSLNQFADYTEEEAASGEKQEVDDDRAVRKTLVVQGPPAGMFNDVRGTRVLQSSKGVSYTSRTMPVRGTQVIQSAGSNQQPAQSKGTMQGTRQIMPNNSPNTSATGTQQFQGTRKIVGAGSQRSPGTQRLQAAPQTSGTRRIAQSTPPTRGTQRIATAAATMNGTRQIKSTQRIVPPPPAAPSQQNGAQYSQSYGTQPIRGTRKVGSVTETGHGTRRIATAGTPEQLHAGGNHATTPPMQQTFRGTQKISAVTPKGTRVIQPNGTAKGTQVIQASNQRVVRGTISLGNNASPQNEKP